MQHLAQTRRLAIALKRRNKRESPKDAVDGSRSQETASDRSIAESTRKIARLTGVLAIIAVVSAAVTAAQWWEIHSSSAQVDRSIQAANRQASAAEEANKISRESIVAANRPWIGLNSVTGAKPIPGQPFSITVTVINSGHEPAINLRGRVSGTIEFNGEIEKKITPDCAFCSHSVALPNNPLVAHVEFDAATMSAGVVEDVEFSKKLILVRGSYRYAGAHGDEHTTNICVVYDPKTSSFPNCESGNDAD